MVRVQTPLALPPRYAGQLRDKTTKFKGYKAELAEIRQEGAVLARTEQILHGRAKAYDVPAGSNSLALGLWDSALKQTLRNALKNSLQTPCRDSLQTPDPRWPCQGLRRHRGEQPPPATHRALC